MKLDSEAGKKKTESSTDISGEIACSDVY